MPRTLPTPSAAAPYINNPAIQIEVQRALRRVESSLTNLQSTVAEQGTKLNSSLSSKDLATITGYVRQQLQSNGTHPLNLASLPGLTAQSQKAKVTTYQQIPLTGSQGDLIVINGQLYVIGTGGAGGSGAGGFTATPLGLQVLLDTHTNRLANYPATKYASGTLFFETDTDAVYFDVSGAWVAAAGGSSANVSLIEVNGSAVGTSGLAANGLVIGFVIGSGTVGTNVGPMLLAPHLGNLSSCTVVVKQSDAAVGLGFDVLQNGTSVFATTPTIAAGATSGQKYSFTSLRSSPVSVMQNDVFTMNISSGSGAWLFTAQLD